MILDDILNQRRPPFDKIGIGYDKFQKNFEEGEIFKIPKKEVEENPKRHTFKHCANQIHEIRISSFQIGSFIPKYHFFFLGTCYLCNNFGPKAINCSTFSKINRRF